MNYPKLTLFSNNCISKPNSSKKKSIMGHIVIPRNVISTMSKMNLWVNFKRNPRYWLMVSACVVAAPSCAISTAVQKMNSYEFLSERANVRLMKDGERYEKYLRGGK